MSETRRRSPDEWPDCPDCDSPLFVDAATGGRSESYKCHKCATLFDAVTFRRDD